MYNSFLEALKDAEMITVNGQGWYSIQRITEESVCCDSGMVFDLQGLDFLAAKGGVQLQSVTEATWKPKPKLASIDPVHLFEQATHKSSVTGEWYIQDKQFVAAKVLTPKGWVFSETVTCNVIEHTFHYRPVYSHETLIRKSFKTLWDLCEGLTFDNDKTRMYGLHGLAVGSYEKAQNLWIDQCATDGIKTDMNIEECLSDFMDRYL